MQNDTQVTPDPAESSGTPNFFQQLAARQARVPIGTDLEIAREPDPEASRRDGERLASVIERAAQRWKTPLAVPLMDLTIEKEWLGIALDRPAASGGTWHFEDEEIPAAMPDTPGTDKLVANCDAIRRVAGIPGMFPCGMCIGPFSLMTKLVSDPITPVFLAGMGEQDEDVARIEALIPLCTEIVLRHARMQVEAGAKAVIVCEPAANTVYFSPLQLEDGVDTFERFVMQPNRRVVEMLKQNSADLIFHDCGELTDSMVRDLATLKPAMMSLGCSRQLWHDAALVPDDVVLYGNLPSKQFYSDDTMPIEKVGQLARELISKMEQTGHPFILGSECDVLSVEGSEETINAKVEAFLSV
jgi:uroporphyrinogen-III decarboxylase